ncbi:hypothetical protein ACNO8X_22840 [Mycobacterium sp. PDNC021]|uniref:hypothetical protein n=1 Tax=Mycobacterium sp. PDNC021 TaxID=3391399 RepID=UPI003AAB5E70
MLTPTDHGLSTDRGQDPAGSVRPGAWAPRFPRSYDLTIQPREGYPKIAHAGGDCLHAGWPVSHLQVHLHQEGPTHAIPRGQSYARIPCDVPVLEDLTHGVCDLRSLRR